MRNGKQTSLGVKSTIFKTDGKKVFLGNFDCLGKVGNKLYCSIKKYFGVTLLEANKPKAKPDHLSAKATPCTKPGNHNNELTLVSLQRAIEDIMGKKAYIE